jgi:hypothetical protein
LENTPELLYNQNEPDSPIDNGLISVIERYHDNHQQKEGRAYKLLGIFLDEHLTLDAHSNHIVSKLTRSLYCIKQAKHIIPASGLKSLYFALIHSHLTYCSLIMHGTTIKNRNKIIKIQKKAIRIMTNSSYNAHTNPLYIEHCILPYELLIKQSQLLFMHSIAYDYAPSSFAGVWVTNANRDPNLNIRNAKDFCLIQPRTETFKKSTLYALPLTWNELAPEIKFQHNRITFKWALKAHLLESLDQLKKRCLLSSSIPNGLIYLLACL